jgi:hypothetical protein
MAAVRHAWMFRTAAVVHLLLGLSAAWRYGFTEYDAAHRLWGLGFGVFAVVVGICLLKPARFAIGLSAVSSALLAIAAALAAPLMKGPVILAFGLLALILGAYAALAARVLMTGSPPQDG